MRSKNMQKVIKYFDKLFRKIAYSPTCDAKFCGQVRVFCLNIADLHERRAMKNESQKPPTFKFYTTH